MAVPAILRGALELRRVHRNINDRWRRYNVYVDDELIGTIGDGQTERFELRPGARSLKLELSYNRLMTSRTVTVQVVAGEVLPFRVAPQPLMESYWERRLWKSEDRIRIEPS